MKLSTEDFVYLFGNEVQVNAYKERKKLVKKTRESLIKKAESMYENVSIVKEGRSNFYLIGAKRDNILVVEDGRATNGKLSQYSKDLDVVVLHRLKNGKKRNNYAKTMNGWMVDFGLISQKLSHAMSPHFLNNKDNVDELLNDEIIKDEDEIRIVKDYIKYTRNLQQNLKSTLERLKKCNIIEFYPVYKARIKLDKETKQQVESIINKEEEYYYTNLDEDIVSKIFEKRREFMSIYGVTDYDVNVLSNKKEVVHFKDRMDEFLRNELKDSIGNHISIDYMWRAYAIVLKSTDKDVIKYLEKYSPEQVPEYINKPEDFELSKIDRFEDGRRDKVIKMAEKQDKFIKDKLFEGDMSNSKMGFNKDNSFVLDDVKIYYDRGYYNIFLNNEYVDRIINVHDYYAKYIKNN